MITFLLLYPGNNIHIKKYIFGPLESHKTIYVSYSFDEYELELAMKAAEEWKRETHGLITFDVKYGFDDQLYADIRHDPDSLVMTRANLTDPIVMKLDKIASNVILGYFLAGDQTKNIMLIPDRMIGYDYYRAVIIHEMGHAIGLGHIKDDDSTVMYKFMSLTYHLTKKDINWLCRVYNCDASLLGGV